MAKIRRIEAITRKTQASKAVKPGPRDYPKQLLELVKSSLEDDKAEDLVVIDLAEKSSIADFMVIVSGHSTRQVGAMADHLIEKLKAAGVKGVAAEGARRCDWVLIDAGDILVHLFRPEVRAFYNIEKMWGMDPPRGESTLAAGMA